ncbi:MAG: phosphate ABC transporter substrate-binding protein [Nostocaceae cyanobacterium]|nr:phosphate ABC transporter substrate-binding protein [Nostocaceae cyanobacterium]
MVVRLNNPLQPYQVFSEIFSPQLGRLSRTKDNCPTLPTKPMKNLRILTSLSVVLASCFWLQSCNKTPETTKGKLLLTGSSTVAPLASAIAKRYQAENPGVQILVQTGGSLKGIADARQGRADIGMASRSLKDSEKDLFAFTLAQDGISIVVHQDNPVKNLTKQQVIDIYTHKINNWRQVGGENAPIIVLNKGESHSTLKLFANFFQMNPKDIHADITIGDNEEAIKNVTVNPNAIAYVSIGAAEHDIIHGTPLKLLPMEGVTATIANVKKGTFPLSRPLNLVTNAPPTSLKKDFIDFARSQHVQDLVREQSFVPVSPSYTK